ncbi:MAG: DUF2335 domain-containing protein [Bacteroidetes bacterium]|nr:DUF2335 domain-containing protein [Bacteroidota bacterium]MCL2302575.1 DUF2335 domain-containing protein [Lentimicrobiaceae bacterium]
MSKKPQISRSVIAQQHYSGPIPPPEALAKYNEVHPGLAERIITMAESEALHRRKTENRMTKSYMIATILGICFAFFSVCIISFLVYYSIYKGFGKEAAMIAIGAIASVAGVFMFFKRANKDRKK